MTSQNPAGSRPANAILHEARAQYADISAALKAARTQLADSGDKDIRAFIGAMQIHWKAMQTVLDKERELEKSDREQAGIVNAYAIDLAAARREVRRRLSCLGAARRD